MISQVNKQVLGGSSSYPHQADFRGKNAQSTSITEKRPLLTAAGEGVPLHYLAMHGLRMTSYASNWATFAASARRAISGQRQRVKGRFRIQIDVPQPEEVLEMILCVVRSEIERRPDEPA